ncbi:LysR family transcriptional regulator [Xylophilus sp.]|uniref:LysR family transcriptional regulator n=1 Tax=Xylophilus sp. TaxID=2653893 RepID=UPI0013BA9D01|nr:LysR family transcriptional regulator [Xylophilus sp.]KAF1047094.1 MAG: HTH-type transcriptional regulator DmlR [Xylophilus sp.]
MPQFRQIEAFVAIVQSGSFVKAADRLALSKAVVSRLVGELEAELGTRLLHRTTRSLSLTGSGAAYYERCRQILEDFAEANAEASAAAARPAGRLRVNAPLSFGNLHWAPLWGEFLKLHPEMELDITLTDRVVDLVDEGFDVGVRIGRVQSETLVVRRLAGDDMLLCASPGYLRRAPPLTRVADIAQHAVLAYSWSSFGDTWTFRTPDGASQSVATHPRLRANSGDTCRAAALADQGLILQPAFIVGHDVRDGRLVRLLPDHDCGRLDIQAIYPSRRHLSGKVRALVDFLAAAFQTPGWK